MLINKQIKRRPRTTIKNKGGPAPGVTTGGVVVVTIVPSPVFKLGKESCDDTMEEANNSSDIVCDHVDTVAEKSNEPTDAVKEIIEDTKTNPKDIILLTKI